jgi:hypothetical protein
MHKRTLAIVLVKDVKLKEIMLEDVLSLMSLQALKELIHYFVADIVKIIIMVHQH